MKPSCNPDSAHPALFTAIRWPKATTPKREQILSMVERAVDWNLLEEIVRPFYQADVRRTGRKGYSLRMMLRCHVLKRLWYMSDRQAEHAVLDSHAFAKFIGTDPWAPRPPSATAIRAFRKTLHENDVDTALSVADLIEQHLTASLRAVGMEFRPGRIEDPVFRKASDE
ncbi:hypothetical protein C8261_08740 [Pseudothauera lacus]|uniref:Transposase InsH N-terminal domain-containing protein n=1 Tax=Pseudothauera lacus TaxID=2136175 RepID=A0A2T4IF48_9RHOO|nr:hypothetical protein C8261_08740 [Pseudothauera lacus]